MAQVGTRNRAISLSRAATGALLVGVMLSVLVGCGSGSDASVPAERPLSDAVSPATAQTETPHDSGDSIAQHLDRIDERLAAIDDLFQPLPLLRAAQETALRQSPYAEQLARAQALGVSRSPSATAIDTLRRRGRLVSLGDSTHWIVRELDYSEPLVVPALRAALVEIGERFHARLEMLGAPPFRLEVSSALRTAASQEALRAVNPNAASGESTHEYGTSIDLAYSAFAAPASPVVTTGSLEPAWASRTVRRYQDVAAGRVAARRALELKAILGEVLIDVQRDGLVLVTMERRQPVFHLTLDRAIASD